MSIKFFLTITIFIGITLTIFISYKYFIGIEIENKTKPLTNFYIIEYDCSGTYEVASKIYVKYCNKYYTVGTTSNQCDDIVEGKLPILYYYEKEDVIFIKNNYYNYSYSIVAFLLLVIVPLFGFYIYRNEWNNSYKTM